MMFMVVFIIIIIILDSSNTYFTLTASIWFCKHIT